MVVIPFKQIRIPFDEVQGNILKGFDKPFVRFIFFHFERDNLDESRAWIRELGRQLTLPSTSKIIRTSNELKDKKKEDLSFRPQDVWLHVSLSYVCINKFGYSPPHSTKMYVKTQNGFEIVQDPVFDRSEDDPFEIGMKNSGHSDKLGDYQESAPRKWDEPFKSGTYARGEPLADWYSNHKQIDILLIVASDNEDDGDTYALQLIERAAGRGITCLGVQIGRSLKNEQGKQVEHFGFRDGVSQPLLRDIDNDEIEKRSFYKDNIGPEEFVLFGLSDNLRWANNGSFLVFRKLSQDVPRFWNFMNENSYKLGLTPELLAARIVGRWKSGAPCTKHRVEPTDPKVSDDNDFQYLKNIDLKSKIQNTLWDDELGYRTPKFAHARVSNPRDSEPGSEDHRMIRRGIPYGASWAEGAEQDRGLLFVCYVRDLYQQFVFHQVRFSNTVGEYSLNSKGEPNDGIKELIQETKGKEVLGLRNWVTTKGGEYFFSPSISSLKSLGARLIIMDYEDDSMIGMRDLVDDFERLGFTVSTYKDEHLAAVNLREIDLVVCGISTSLIGAALRFADPFGLTRKALTNDPRIRVCLMVPVGYDVATMKDQAKKLFDEDYARVFIMTMPSRVNDDVFDQITREIAKS